MIGECQPGHDQEARDGHHADGEQSRPDPVRPPADDDPAYRSKQLRDRDNTARSEDRTPVIRDQPDQHERHGERLRHHQQR
jgi:hypothetical protein